MNFDTFENKIFCPFPIVYERNRYTAILHDNKLYFLPLLPGGIGAILDICWFHEKIIS